MEKQKSWKTHVFRIGNRDCARPMIASRAMCQAPPFSKVSSKVVFVPRQSPLQGLFTAQAEHTTFNTLSPICWDLRETQNSCFAVAVARLQQHKGIGWVYYCYCCVSMDDGGRIAFNWKPRATKLIGNYLQYEVNERN